ncbi:glyoxalase [Bacillus sp. EAC]|uniref:glyoxalase n=1 Tax=Bacillus sp. EAC TaxID=1978338 RepID=UPI000B452973|nr:glyoxalase [Bacillus sp. EAC]
MLINKVVLLTTNLVETRDFYINKLQFESTEIMSDSFTVKVGNSLLKFIETQSEKDPFYHFAFNIPANKFREAKEWAQTKVNLTIEDGKDEIFFEFLNAHSFYFEDPSGNIVEFISRHSISPNTSKDFSPKSIIGISEINVTTKDVHLIGNRLILNGIQVREDREINESLNFMGSKGCFLLLGPPKRRWLFSEKIAEVFPVSITVDNKLEIKVTDIGEVSIIELK